MKDSKNFLYWAFLAAGIIIGFQNCGDLNGVNPNSSLDAAYSMTATVPAASNGTQSSSKVSSYAINPEKIIFGLDNSSSPGSPQVFQLDIHSGVVTEMNSSVGYTLNAQESAELQSLLSGVSVSVVPMNCEFPAGVTPTPSYQEILVSNVGEFYLGNGCLGGPDLYGDPSTDPNWAKSSDAQNLLISLGKEALTTQGLTIHFFTLAEIQSLGL
jgi:hypothetical protein